METRPPTDTNAHLTAVQTKESLPMTRTVSGHAHDANHDLHFPKRRLQHVFAKDGRALIVAMDGARNGPAKGLENPR